VLGARRRFARRSIRFLVILPAASLLVALGVQSLIRLTGAHRDVFEARVQLLRHSGSSSDQSYLDRLNQTKSAWKAFERSPVFGVGPGYTFRWEGPAGVEESATTIDSPAEYQAKFGLIGLAALLMLAWSFTRTLQALRRRTGERTIAQLALIGFAGAFLAWCLLGVPFDDKGLASGYMLLLALALSEASAATRAATFRA
jgi:O-antigen ligase